MRRICEAAGQYMLRGQTKKELLGYTRSVTVQEHKWYRSVIGMMCYYAVQTRWDIAFQVNSAAQFLEGPTQGVLADAIRILAYLVGTCRAAAIVRNMDVGTWRSRETSWVLSVCQITSLIRSPVADTNRSRPMSRPLLLQPA